MFSSLQTKAKRQKHMVNFWQHKETASYELKGNVNGELLLYCTKLKWYIWFGNWQSFWSEISFQNTDLFLPRHHFKNITSQSFVWKKWWIIWVGKTSILLQICRKKKTKKQRKKLDKNLILCVIHPTTHWLITAYLFSKHIESTKWKLHVQSKIVKHARIVLSQITNPVSSNITCLTKDCFPLIQNQ